jgi:L,D-peptidoglycan transpeptidase YkuD (ErfK/YbiS/YcfS/YnhG family)
MWRDDHLYDIVVVLDWNTGPVAKGCGSAIFLHLTRPDRGPTEGCIALPMDTLRPLVARLCRETCFVTG